MKHLSPEQIVDLTDGCADAAAVAHAASCDACRAEVESFRRAVSLAESDQVPDPSPLVWPHLAARIGEAVRREPKPAASWRLWGRWLIPAAGLAGLVVAVGIMFRPWRAAPGSGSTGPAATPPQAVSAPAVEDDLADDPSWALVSDLSAQVSLEDAEASGALPLPGDVDGALLQLDVAERVELARILREELAPMRSGVVQGPGA